MQEQLKNIENIPLEELKLAKDSTTVENIRVKYLGKKGELTTILRSMGGLSKEERPIMGKLVNEVKATLEAKLEEVLTQIKIKEKNEKLANEVIDISIPGTKNLVGKRQSPNLTRRQGRQSASLLQPKSCASGCCCCLTPFGY